MVWTQIRINILSVLIWVQTICKDYQQETKISTSKEIVTQFYTEFGLPHQIMRPNLFASWVKFNALLSSADFFSKLTFSKNSFRNTIRTSNLRIQIRGPNYLQRQTTKVAISKERVEPFYTRPVSFPSYFTSNSLLVMSIYLFLLAPASLHSDSIIC